MKQFWKKEDGAIILIVALGMTVFLGCLALVVDMGSLYLEKSRLQKITDAAVLAGAQEMPTNFEKAKEAINKTIVLNGGDLTDFTISTNEHNTVLEVGGTVKGSLFFAKTFGITEPDVSASAKVTLHGLTSGKGAIPLGISMDQNLAFGVQQELKVSDSASGNFGAIALTGPGSRLFETDLTLGYNFELNVNDVLATETGRMSNPTKRAIQDRITRCPGGKYDNYEPDCTRLVLVPVIQPVEISSNQIKQVKVVGFATFFIESVGDGAEVRGRFIEFAHEGGSSPTQPNYGTYGFKLSQ